MPARKSAGISLSITNPAEEMAAKFIKGTTPWLVWLGGIPLACAAFRGLGAATHHVRLVSAGLLAGALIVTAVTWHVTHARRWGRVHHALNAAGAMGVIWAVAARGPMAWRGAVLVFWAVAGMVACIVWNVRYSVHSDGVEDVLTARPARRSRRFNWPYLIRIAAGRAPVIRAGAEKAGKVVPALVSPWREPSRDLAGNPAAAIAAPGDPEAAPEGDENAQRMWQAVQKNWRDLAAHKVPDLNGARIRLLDARPWRIRAEIILVRGVQTPKVITDARELMASQNALPLSSVIVKANPRRHDRVFADFVLEDVLATVRHWPGPSAPGRSVADAPVRFGVYEDRQYAESWETAITEEMSRRLGVPEQNLSHPISEGMTGSGKSTIVRIVIADGATRTDVEDWAIDTVKKFQTLGCVAGALAWFATKPAEARAMIRFLADLVIPERANYLGMHGYDNWEPGCGLPFLRVTIEEGGIIANELDKLDHVLNSARSAGVKIRASFQRAHHAVLDTNVRAAFGESLSFGVKSADDIFVMDDDLREAGADPSLWSDKQPGMLYRSAASIPFERRLMPLRGFKPDPLELAAVVAANAPARDARIAADCPDWAAMLASLDANGTWARRTTGAAVLEQMETASRRKEARSAGTPPPPAQPYRPQAMTEDEEIIEGELVPDYPPDDAEETPVSMDELDLDPELAEGVAEDEGTDPRQPLAPVDPGDVLSFGRPRDEELGREDALRLVRSYLMQRGNGWEFTPRDLYGDLCPATGRKASWIRGELSTTLVAEGLVDHDRPEGRYRVVLTQDARP